MEIDRARLKALREYEIMDTPPEETFEDLSKLTSFICGTPIAAISLLDDKRQWFKSNLGWAASETPLEHAFCAHAIRQQEVFLVPDASLDDRFQRNPLVTGDPHIRFYAGAPLITPEGVGVGSLCAIDRRPRELTKEQHEALQALARQVIASLELRKTNKALQVAIAEKQIAEKEAASLKDLLPMCAWCRKIRDDHDYWHNVEDYISAHSQTKFSHGVCPVCAAKLRQEMARPSGIRN